MQQFQMKLEANLVALVAGWQQVPTCILQNTRLFINGFIDIFFLKSETEVISLNFPRYFTQKIGDKCVENISGYHLK